MTFDFMTFVENPQKYDFRFYDFFQNVQKLMNQEYDLSSQRGKLDFFAQNIEYQMIQTLLFKNILVRGNEILLRIQEMVI